jgi:uncharacterized protein YbjT (DUF2867 family)
LHVVFGTGPVGMAVMDQLVSKGTRVRMVNRSGRVRVPHGVEVAGGDATDANFAREASVGASVVYFALNPPYNQWPELFPPLQAGVIEGAAAAGAKLIAMKTSTCMVPQTVVRSPRTCPTQPTREKARYAPGCPKS